ncbi:MAG TPA: hypothetical protein VGY98_12220, partial [Verrucomicrobiae bacterium]|nr:hypothetical protein [Verrucomicrobiae bacterium]
VYIKGFQYVQEQPGLFGSVVWPPLPAASGSSFVGTTFATPVELTDLPFGISVTNVWGIPWIVGAKKGLPNFNGFELDNTFFVERELQFNRNNNAPGTSGSTFPYGRTYTTNQMYLIGVSNTFAMDDWNSYGNQYNNNINVYAQNFLSVALTNSANLTVQNLFATNVGFPFANWPGQLFVMPFGTNITVMQNLSLAPSPPATNGLYLYYASPNPVTFSGITFRGPCFIPSSLDPSNYLDSGTPPLPQFGLMATNHLQAFLLDTDRNGNNHILDYVQLGSMNSALNVNAAIADPDSDIAVNGDNGGLWSTNYYAGTATPYGIIEQYLVSSGSPFPGGVDGDEATASGQTGWATAPVPGLGNWNSVAAQQAYFEAFFTAGNIAYDNADGKRVTNLSLSVQAPFTPMRAIIQRYVYQANDPLVHYLSSDLNDIADDTSNKVNIATIQTNSITTIGILSDRYMPWGNYTPGENPAGGPPTVNQLKPANINFGYPIAQSVMLDQNQYNFSYRDPLVWSSDNWDFPTAKYPTAGWLGRVHRGTPWQSVYLKSTNIWSLSGTANGLVNQGPATWEIWTGDLNANDAFNEIPAQDRLLFDIFTAAPDDDAMRGQLSVNIGADNPTDMLAGLASWSALLSGTVVFATNNVNDQVLGYTPGYQSPTPVWQENAPYFTVMTNQPLGVPLYPITQSPMWQIVQGINSTRTNFTTLDGLQGVFEHAGDVLATPELSDASPYLASGDQNQLQYGVSDEMYEWLPQQIMGLVTASGAAQNPPRYVVYCYGQTLKPAPNGLVSSGQFFGMCTNYQVTAESAARVVIEVQNPP